MAVEETRAALLEQDPPRLQGRDDVPEALATLVDAALRHAPEERPASASTMAKRLRGWLAKSHPEGVAAELGERARSALKARSDPAGKRVDAEGERTEPSRVVKTLATSPALDYACKCDTLALTFSEETLSRTGYPTLPPEIFLAG